MVTMLRENRIPNETGLERTEHMLVHMIHHAALIHVCAGDSKDSLIPLHTDLSPLKFSFSSLEINMVGGKSSTLQPWINCGMS